MKRAFLSTIFLVGCFASLAGWLLYGTTTAAHIGEFIRQTPLWVWPVGMSGCLFILYLLLLSRREVTMRPKPVFHLHSPWTYFTVLFPWSRGRRAYVLCFHGDHNVTARDKLTKEITVVLDDARQGDIVVLNLHSGGGGFEEYDQCLAELKRVKKDGRIVQLIICVDAMAASGGYYLACLADELVASPAAQIGSIGLRGEYYDVVDALRNFLGINIMLVVRGEHKLDGDPLERLLPNRQSSVERMADEHYQQFKDHVEEHRRGKVINIDAVATGQTWKGEKAKELGLIDEVITSNQKLRELSQAGFRLMEVTCKAWTSVNTQQERLSPSEVILSRFAQCIGSILKDLGMNCLR